MQVDFIEKHVDTGKTLSTVQLDNRSEKVCDIKMNE